MDMGIRYTMGMGDQSTMGNVVKIPWVEFTFSIYSIYMMQI